jgi:hypothetical protein
MSTPNFKETQHLTQDEEILHHHVAVIKKDLEAYHACFRSKKDWNCLFKKHLVHLFL